MTKKSEERLQELLDKKDEEIEATAFKLNEAEERIATLERRLEHIKDGWMLPGESKEDSLPQLPLPRLEMRWFPMYENDGEGEEDWSDYRVTYSLILRHLTGTITSIPLGMTVVNCSGGYKDVLPGLMRIALTQSCCRFEMAPTFTMTLHI